MWRILVVDDDFVSRRLLVEILKGKAECDIATNGKEAGEAYSLSRKENRPYELILLDIAMPECDGLQFLKQVRDEEQRTGVPLGEGIPIVMVTAFKQPFLEAFNRGCDDYLLKPIHAATLLEKVEAKISQSRK